MITDIKDNEAKTIATNQTISTSWADLGTDAIFACGDMDAVSLWVDLDRNSATDISFRPVGRLTSDGDNFDLLIQTASSTKLSLDPLVFEVNTDVDQKIIIPLSLDRSVPFMKWQVKAGTGTDAVVLSAKIVVKRGG